MVRYDSAGRRITKKRIETAKKNIKKAREKWKKMSHKKRQKVMPSRKYKGLSEAKIKKLVTAKGKRYVPIGEYAWIDVGRPKNHYVLAKKTKYGWERRGIATLKTLQKNVEKARKKWVKMSPKARAKVMPERKGKKGYVKVKIKKHSKTGKLFDSYVWKKRAELKKLI